MKEEIAQAFRDGVRLCQGFPVQVKTSWGLALHNLAMPGFYTGYEEPLPGVICTWCHEGATWYVDGMEVQAENVRVVAEVAMAVGGIKDRHSSEAERIRLESGKRLMSLGDAHIRARMLDATGAWSAVAGELIEDSPTDGKLHVPVDTDIAERARLLIVTCPSTGRIYGHLIPIEDAASAKEAREWLMGGPAPEVET